MALGTPPLPLPIEGRGLQRRPLPLVAGLSHMEIVESDPEIGETQGSLAKPCRAVCGRDRRNRIGNEPESECERVLRDRSALDSGGHISWAHFSYAIPLPRAGRGRTRIAFGVGLDCFVAIAPRNDAHT